jgi:hypothetical protein
MEIAIMAGSGLVLYDDRPHALHTSFGIGTMGYEKNRTGRRRGVKEDTEGICNKVPLGWQTFSANPLLVMSLNMLS